MDELEWIHNNEAMNLSVVIVYPSVDSTINGSSSSLRPFSPKRRVSTKIESVDWLKIEYSG